MPNWTHLIAGATIGAAFVYTVALLAAGLSQNEQFVAFLLRPHDHVQFSTAPLLIGAIAGANWVLLRGSR